jgi:hypothetical protein
MSNTLKRKFIMKNQLIVASLLTLASVGSAFAGPADFNLQNRTPFQGTLTREQVKAELAAAVRDGTLPQVGESYDYTAKALVVAAPRNRADVRAEARQAARSHTSQELM